MKSNQSKVTVQVFAHNDFLIMCPSVAKLVNNHFYPTNDDGNMGCVLINSKRGLQVSKEAFELMGKIQKNHDCVGDLGWWKCDDGKYAFSWWGAIYRIVNIHNSEADRDFGVHPDQCTIIPNRLTPEMKVAVEKAEKPDGEKICHWQEPIFVKSKKKS